METVILEKTIIKLGGLLALGFGEAGAEIIGQNMKCGQTTGVDPMTSGVRVDVIVGYATIFNFLIVNQVLGEKIMVFVNQIGEIVHGVVDDFNGAANKNVGDSFLLIWRLTGSDEPAQRKLADMAILSFVKIVTELNKSPVLAQYRKHPCIVQRIKNYRVKLGFGLHCGWAIEGAIGSDFKIDASYLSPNVNIAVSLEAATLKYDVWFLMSHFMLSLCSQEVAMLCRCIDHVSVQSARLPIRICTIDLNYDAIDVKYYGHRKLIKNRFKIRQIRELWKQDKWQDEYQVANVFELDEDILNMRSLFSPEFFRRFATAYRNYEAGSWKVARDLFFTCFYEPRRDVGSKPWISGS
jgi:class 3 adenylate cyclase